RLQQSIEEAKKTLSIDDKAKEKIPVEVFTLHQLLGAGKYNAQFKYNEENLLPYDCVIVDEVSMVDQAMLSALMDALSVETRLILLGDKDQLASVEAGSVLGDICGYQIENSFTKAIGAYLHKLDIQLPEERIAFSGSPLNDHIILLQKN